VGDVNVAMASPVKDPSLEGAYQKCQTKATQPAQDDFLMLVRKRVEKIAFQIALVLSAAKALIAMPMCATLRYQNARWRVKQVASIIAWVVSVAMAWSATYMIILEECARFLKKVLKSPHHCQKHAKRSLRGTVWKMEASVVKASSANQ